LQGESRIYITIYIQARGEVKLTSQSGKRTHATITKRQPGRVRVGTINRSVHHWSTAKRKNITRNAVGIRNAERFAVAEGVWAGAVEAIDSVPEVTYVCLEGTVLTTASPLRLPSILAASNVAE
jgi:hypothetical protein